MNEPLAPSIASGSAGWYRHLEPGAEPRQPGPAPEPYVRRAASFPTAPISHSLKPASSGSLSPCDAPARAADFVSQLPTPGKQVCLRQALAFEPPTAEVAYAVDLAGKYCAGR